MRGDMALSTIAKWFVLLVVLGIGIVLMTDFSHNAKNYLGDSTDPKYNTTMVQANSFSDSQIKLYIKSCETRIGERTDEDFSCYLLEGDMSGINPKNLTDSSLNYPLDTSSFNTKNPIAEIKYDHIFKKIIIAN
jgi:hypothetical protein